MTRSSARLCFVGGKGGVGKTTIAAAAALAAADAGRRTLVLSVDPAHSLGDVLDVAVPSRPRRVPGTRRLHAMELDAVAALRAWLAARRDRLVRLLLRGTYLDEDDVRGFLDLSAPGVDEVVGLLEVARLADEGVWDQVVVDTAPTGHTVRLLGMPRTLAQVARVLGDMDDKHRFMVSALGGRPGADRASALIEELASDAERLRATLRDPARTRFRWVTVPEDVALAETARTLSLLDREGLPVEEVIVNRVHAFTARACRFCRVRARSEAAAITGAHRRLGDRPVRVLPAYDEEPRGVAPLRQVAAALARGGHRSLKVRGFRLQAEEAFRLTPDATRGEALRLTPDAAGRGDATAGLGLPESLRLLLIAGKGGVGKTTCAAALGLELADRWADRRVLLLSTDPAHSLGDVLRARVGDTARTMRGAPRNLFVRELDADSAFEAMRRRYRAAVEELFARITGGAIDVAFDRRVVEDLLDLAPPGLDELVAIVAVMDLVGVQPGAAPDGLIVMDLAPTGHALRLLEMPDLAHAWVGRLLAILLKYREVIGLGDVAAELVATSRGLRRLRELLRDERRTRALVVLRPAIVPRVETERLLGDLRRLDLPVAGVIVNGVTPCVCASRGRSAAVVRERREIARIAARARSRGPGECAIILAPARATPPRAPRALRAWRRAWIAAAPS